MDNDYKKDFDEFFKISQFDQCDMENITKDEFYEKFKQFQEKKRMEISQKSIKSNENINLNHDNNLDLNDLLNEDINNNENSNDNMINENINIGLNIFNLDSNENIKDEKIKEINLEEKNELKIDNNIKEEKDNEKDLEIKTITKSNNPEMNQNIDDIQIKPKTIDFNKLVEEQLLKESQNNTLKEKNPPVKFTYKNQTSHFLDKYKVSKPEEIDQKKYKYYTDNFNKSKSKDKIINKSQIPKPISTTITRVKKGNINNNINNNIINHNVNNNNLTTISSISKMNESNFSNKTFNNSFNINKVINEKSDIENKFYDDEDDEIKIQKIPFSYILNLNIEKPKIIPIQVNRKDNNKKNIELILSNKSNNSYIKNNQLNFNFKTISNPKTIKKQKNEKELNEENEENPKNINSIISKISDKKINEENDSQPSLSTINLLNKQSLLDDFLEKEPEEINIKNNKIKDNNKTKIKNLNINNNKDLYNNELIREKLNEIEKQLHQIKIEKKKVNDLRESYEKLTKKLKDDINKFKKEREYERIQFEKYKEEEMKKVEREKRSTMKNINVNANNISQQLKAQKDENEELKLEIIKLKEELKNKENRNNLVIERLRKQYEESQKEIENLQNELDLKNNTNIKTKKNLKKI